MGRLEDLRINAYLSEVARGYRNNAFVADVLFPTIYSEKEKIDIFQFNKEAFNIYDVTALDLESDEIKYLRKKNNYKNLNFLNRNFTTYTDINQYDVIYSRFSIHAITENDEDETLKNSYKNLKNNGLLLIEVRSIKDQMFIDSQCLSDNEGVTDHYRRFIDFSKLKQKLEGLNFKIIYSIESTGLAIHGNEDPSIIRFVAQKKDYKL